MLNRLVVMFLSSLLVALVGQMPLSAAPVVNPVSNPTISIRITRAGLDSIMDAVAKESAASATKSPVPDVALALAGGSANLKGLRISKLELPKLTYELQESNKLRVKVNLPQSAIAGSLDATRSIATTQQTDTSSFDFTIADTNLELSAAIDTVASGTPKVDQFDCKSKLGLTQVNLRNNREKFTPDIINTSAKTLGQTFETQACSLLTTQLTKHLNKALSQFKPEFIFGKARAMKGQSSLSVGPDSIDVNFFEQLVLTKEVSPAQPAKFPKVEASDGMIAVLISDNAFNDMAYQAFVNQKLAFVISPDSQPIFYNLLRLQCDSAYETCLGKIAPELWMKYGTDALVRAAFKANKAPTIEFSPGKATFTGSLVFDLFVTPKNVSTEVHEATANLDVRGSFAIKIKDEMLYGKVSIESIKVKFDQLHSKKWEEKINNTIQKLVEGYVNGNMLLNGIPLQLPFGTGHKEPAIKLRENSLQVSNG